MAPDIIVIAWYRREDYGRIFALAEGGGGMEPTFEEWEKFVEAVMPDIVARGVPVKKVIIDPREFAAWLRKEKRESTPESRALFAHSIASKQAIN